MKKTVQQIPFLRPTVALAFGIFVGSKTEFSVPLLFAISIVCFLGLLITNQYYKYRFLNLFGIGTFLLFTFIGVLIFVTCNKEPEFIDNGFFIATVLEKPQEKKNSYKSLIKLSSVKKDSTTCITNEKVLVYFQKNINVKKLEPGDIIIFSATPQIIKNYGNPFEFDYKKYLERKKIYRQIYLPSNNWKTETIISNLTLTIRAEQFREKLLNIYRNQNLGKNELEILSALTLGYKRELDPETKRVFSASGAMHVLAVSGLHVGIIFLVISFLFGFLKKQKTGRIIFVIISILLLWSYAFITGLSPSVMRASTMFTIFVIGENINRKPNSYNSLAASAMFLLLINPNNLFEVGFQLSYSAVFGILFLQPKIAGIVTVKNKFIKFFWILLTVSIGAQIATFPISVFYFNQFPTYFWITNLIVIPAVTVLIPLGISLLLFAKIPILNIIISVFLKLIIKLCFLILSQIEQFPFSVFEISIHPIQLFFLIGILFTLYLFLKSYRAIHLKTGLIFLVFLLISSFALKTIHLNKSEIIVYNNNNLTIQVISGKTNFVVCEINTNSLTETINTIKNTNLRFNLNPPEILTLNDSLYNDYLLFKNGVLIFQGKTILIDKKFSDFKKSNYPDFIINPKQFNELEDFTSTNTLIISNKRFKRLENSISKPIHYTSNQGAFREKW